MALSYKPRSPKHRIIWYFVLFPSLILAVNAAAFKFLLYYLMGKKGGTSSWLTAVKRAFRSPTKDDEDQKVFSQKSKIF